MRVLRVLAPNPGPFTLEGTNTWIVGTPPSLVIDPGPDDPDHLRAVLEEAREIAAILLTHRHPDHAPGAASLARLARAPVYAFRPERYELGLVDRRAVESGAVRLVAIYTPGHSSDHIAFWEEEGRLLFTGDAVLGRGTSIVSPPDGDMGAYQHSLEVMRDLGPGVIYPGHGPVVFDAERKLREYIAHRIERERQVLRALAAGMTRAEDLVPSIYGREIPEDMYPAAARSVLAHLLKLEREGRVARTGKTGEGRFTLVRTKPCARCGRPSAAGSKYCRQCSLALLQEGR